MSSRVESAPPLVAAHSSAPPSFPSLYDTPLCTHLLFSMFKQPQNPLAFSKRETIRKVWHLKRDGDVLVERPIFILKRRNE